MDWYGIQPKQEWNGNNKRMCSLDWAWSIEIKGQGFHGSIRKWSINVIEVQTHSCLHPSSNHSNLFIACKIYILIGMT